MTHVDRAFIDSLVKNGAACHMDPDVVGMMVAYFSMSDAERAAVNDPVAPLPKMKHAASFRAIASAQKSGRQRFRAALTARASATRTSYAAQWRAALAAAAITSVVSR